MAHPVPAAIVADHGPAAAVRPAPEPGPPSATVQAVAAGPAPEPWSVTVQRVESPPPSAAPPAPADGEPEALLAKLYDPLLRRLKAELRIDRDRYGSLTDLRR